ncbi:hypothetical protein [Aestuariimicrobium sp. Y1814]|uniref:hypothetical protein n=1 Tax=Aestuariimicrobium sp. Y1814 TaxID=3418742 RepID=UPI003DA6E547
MPETLTGAVTRADHRTESHAFTAGDGLPLTLVRVRAEGHPEPWRGPVMLVHGAGVRGELFRPPVQRTLVDALLEDGWDVWLLNWRASIDLPPVPWTLDDAAAYDHPYAVRHVLQLTGATTMKAVVHCQGSTSFTMSAVAGLLPGVDTVVTNAVSLHPVLPRWSRLKIHALTPMLTRLTPHLDPGWGDQPDSAMGWLTRTAVLAGHRECDNAVCRLVSFTYGAGRPALWSHANLDEATHDWLRGEFGRVPVSFFAHMRACVAAGRMVQVSDNPKLPDDFTAEAPQTDARFAFFAGEDNLSFLPESQQLSWEFFRQHRPDRGDTLHRLAHYGHLDLFLGKDAAHDVHPLILAELRGP